MKVNLDILDRSEKNRIIIFTFITVLVAVIALGFIWGAHEGRFYKDEINESSGSGFEAMVDITTYIVNFMFAMLSYIIGGNVYIVNIEALAFGIFYTKTLKEIKYVKETEYHLATWILTVMLIVSIIISLFMIRTAFIEFLFTGWPIFFMWLFGYLFYIRPLKQKRQKYI